MDRYLAVANSADDKRRHFGFQIKDLAGEVHRLVEQRIVCMRGERPRRRRASQDGAAEKSDEFSPSHDMPCDYGRAKTPPESGRGTPVTVGGLIGSPHRLRTAR